MFYYIALLLTALIFILVGIAGAEPYAYITNQRDNTVSVIDINTNTVAATVYGFNSPYGVVVTPDGSKVYVTNQADNTVSVINTTTNTVISTVPVGSYPTGIAVSPDGTNVYVANYYSNTVSVINTATDSVYNTLNVGAQPEGVVVSPNGANLYVANYNSNTVYQINTATNIITNVVGVGCQLYGIAVTPDGTKLYVTCYGNNNVYVISTVSFNVLAAPYVGAQPEGVAVSPNGANVYVANYNSNTVSIINTATNNVNNVGVGNGPASFGKFIEKLTPIINWSKPANITYGTALSSTQLDASASDPISGTTVPGTFVYNPPAGTLLNAGTQLLNTIFMPTDTVNYNSASASVLINVLTNPGNSNGNGVTFTNWGNNNVYIINPATNNLEAAASVGYMSSSPWQFWSSPVVPTITWNNPANINYGTALSSIQLDATSSVPGTFVYAPPAGTVLGVGTQALNAFFTPNDLVHYTNTSASVWINVVNNPT